jgi:ATP-dependent exoDNAse (exonuclease V) beta subunit
MDTTSVADEQQQNKRQADPVEESNKRQKESSSSSSSSTEAPPEQQSLAEKHPHPRDRNLRAVHTDKEHYYEITLPSGEKLRVGSVTGCYEVLFPKFNADRTIDEMASSKNWTKNKYYGRPREEIKREWLENGDRSRNLGTEAHANIERFYNGEPYLAEMPEFRLFMQFHREWVEPRGWEPWRTEWPIYSTQLKLAGTIDMLYRKPDTGGFVIADWKRAKELKKFGFCRCPREGRRIPVHKPNCGAFGCHPLTERLRNCNVTKYTLQLNIYCWMLRRHYNIRVEELYLVAMHPEQPDPADPRNKAKNGTRVVVLQLEIWDHLVTELMRERDAQLNA